MNWIGIFFYSSNRHDHRIWLASQVTKKKVWIFDDVAMGWLLMMIIIIIDKQVSQCNFSLFLSWIFVSLSLSLSLYWNKTKRWWKTTTTKKKIFQRHSCWWYGCLVVVYLLIFICWFCSIFYTNKIIIYRMNVFLVFG